MHDTTKARPIDLLDVERASLLPLKPSSTFTSLFREERRVSRDAFVHFDGSRYAVPWTYAGRFVQVTASQAHVEILDGNDRIVIHPRGLVPGMTITLPGQYDGAPLATPGRSGHALGRHVVGPDVQVRPLEAYEALAGHS